MAAVAAQLAQAFLAEMAEMAATLALAGAVARLPCQLTAALAEMAGKGPSS